MATIITHQAINEQDWREMGELCSLSAQELLSLKNKAESFYPVIQFFQQLLIYNESHSDKEALLAESFAYGVLQTGELHLQWLSNQHQNPSLENKHDSPVLLERTGNRLNIFLNRPKFRNAYSAAMRDGLYEALQLLDIDHSIELCELRGIGDCFCVGGDLTEFGQRYDIADAYSIRLQRNVAALLLKNSKRITSYVHSACIGSGIELPACAGRVVASEDAFFQLPELNMGLIPGAGATVSILRRIGRVRLLWWFLSGKKINARSALEWGLVDQIE